MKTLQSFSVLIEYLLASLLSLLFNSMFAVLMRSTLYPDLLTNYQAILIGLMLSLYDLTFWYINFERSDIKNILTVKVSEKELANRYVPSLRLLLLYYLYAIVIITVILLSGNSNNFIHILIIIGSLSGFPLVKLGVLDRLVVTLKKLYGVPVIIK